MWGNGEEDDGCVVWEGADGREKDGLIARSRRHVGKRAHCVREYTMQKCGNWLLERKNKVYHIGLREVQVRVSDWKGCVVKKQVHKKCLGEDSSAQRERVLEHWLEQTGVH